jgi:hypothetical protein
MNIKNIAKGFLVLAFLAGAVIASPAKADNNTSENSFVNAEASLKADFVNKIENSVGVVMGPNGTLRVLGAKVTSVSGSDINATAAFGNSSMSFVVKTDADTKLNGKALSDSSVLSGLKAGDRISFAGTIASSSSSSLTIDASHVISRDLYSGKTIDDHKQDKDKDNGDIGKDNNNDHKGDKNELRGGFWGKIRSWFNK